MLENQMSTVARVAKIYGPKGELTLQLFDTFPTNFPIQEPLFIQLDGLAVPLFLERFERRGRSGATARFADIDSERRAGELVGCELRMTLEEKMTTEDEQNSGRVYLEDLVGFKAILNTADQNPKEAPQGRIEEIIDGENPLWRVKVEEVEVLIPAVEELIVEIDMKQKVLIFELPEGLLALYME